MKTPYKFLLAGIAIAGLITGCAAFSGTTPPNAIESKLFTTVTNFVTQVQTNTVTLTNVTPVTQVLTITNTQNQVIQETNMYQVTNTVTEHVVETNQVAQYSMTPNSSSSSGASTVGGLANLVIPGSGGLVTYGLMGLLGLWGYLRSAKTGQAQGAAASALSQELQTVLQFVGQLPGAGPGYVAALESWLQSHQAETGVVQTVLDIIEKDVSNNDAQAAVAEISSLIATMSTAKAPTTASAPTPAPTAAVPKTS